MLDFVVPAAALRLRSCVLGAHLEAFCARLVDLGYRRATIRQKLLMVNDLMRWMAGEHLAVVDLDEGRAEECLAARWRRGRTCRGFRSTVLLLLEQLRCAGVVPTPEPACDHSPRAVLLARYEEYVRRERALAQATIGAYLPFVRAFVDERLDRGAACPGATDEVLYHPKPAHERGEPCAQRFDPAEFLARLLQHVPAPRLHQVRYYGRYSNVARARAAGGGSQAHPAVSPRDEEPDTAQRRQARRAWAHLIRRVYEVDPLICRECGGEMGVLAFILEPVAIRKILTHLERQAKLAPRGPLRDFYADPGSLTMPTRSP